jgi:hypothetical protein
MMNSGSSSPNKASEMMNTPSVVDKNEAKKEF